MELNSLNEVLEIGNTKLEELDFNILYEDQHIISNPFSLIHPGFLFYIWGKFQTSIEKFQKAIDVFNDQIQKSLDSQNYADAGEFAILSLKAEGRIPSSTQLKSNYKKAKKILKNLTELFPDAYYVSSLIEVEEIYEKYSGIKIQKEKLEDLYRKASFQYFLEAESIIAKDLINIRIMDYFEAANYLNKIKYSLNENDTIQKEIIANKMISEILLLMDRKDKMKHDIENYSKIYQKINLEFGLGKAYSLVNKKTESKLFYGRSLRRLDKLIKDNTIRQSLLRSREILYKEENHYKIQNIKLFSQSLFEKVIVFNEKIELFDLRMRILESVEDLEKSNRIEAKNEILKSLIELHLNLIELFENELNQKYEQNVREKYKAFIIYLLYQVYKLMKKKKNKK